MTAFLRGLVLFTLLVICAQAGPTYFVTAPNLFHVGMEETVLVLVHEVPGPIPVTVEVKNEDKSRTLARNENLPCQPDTPTTVRLKIREQDLGEEELEGGTFYIHLLVSSTHASLKFSKETRILATHRVGHVFLQLDKPLYHPNGKMESRAYNVDQNLRPSPRKVRLEVKTPDGDVMSQEDKESRPHSPGIIEFTPFRFPQIPTLGIWTATAYYGNKWQYKHEVEFEVKDYVLPRFEVDVKFSDIITPDREQATGHVTARYTYLKNVQGTITLKYSVGNDDITTDFFTETHTLVNGIYNYLVDLNLVKNLGDQMWFPAVLQRDTWLQVHARVREEATGAEQEGFARIPFANSMFKISLKRTLAYFKPALPFVVNVDVTSMMPLTERQRRIPISIVVHSVSAAGKKTSVGLYRGQNADANTDESGQAKLTIDNVPRDSHHLDIQVKTRFGAGQFANAETTFQVNRQQTESDSYIMLRVEQTVVEVGSNIQVEVFSTAQERSRLNYFVLANGEIMEAHTIVEQGGTYQILTLTIRAEMSPQAHLFAYYYVTKNGRSVIVADSVILDVENKCRNEVQLQAVGGETIKKPGDEFNLLINASPNSKVALLAVDKSVYLLREEGVLHRYQLFDLLRERDLSCTVGGGQNSESIFGDGGITMLTNTQLGPKLRTKELCQDIARPRRRRDADDTPETLEDCCRQGRNYTSNCAYHALQKQKQGASLNCTNLFYKCCQAQIVTTPTPTDSSRGRLGGRNFGDEIFNLIGTEKARLQKRHQFDESWLWEIADIDRRGASSRRITLKDTITSWVFQGVGMSASRGLCIASPLNITTRKDFFIHLQLPVSAVMGEQVEIRATIFNYAKHAQPVVAFLEGVDGLCSGGDPGEQTGERHIEVSGNDAVSLSWPVIPLRTGEIPIRIQAFVRSDSDYIEKKLNVIPPGKEHRKSQTVVLDPAGESVGHVDKPHNVAEGFEVIPNKNERKQKVIIDMKIPMEYVADSAKIAISFWGEMLGPIVEGVLGGMEAMIRQPKGCGEQTMIYLGPTVYTARYLKRSGQMTADMEKKAYSYIKQGVQREMTFRKPDTGSFAVWTHYPSSSWLTSFVIKIFAQAREFNVVTSNLTSVICTAARWVSQYRNREGFFFDPYKTHHKGDMIGAVYNKQTLTAFIVIALHEANCPLQETHAAMDAAAQFLSTQYGQMQRAFDVAITTYALALRDHPSKLSANNRLKSMASYDPDKNLRYWPHGGAPLQHRSKAPSVEVETAAYALLAQLQMDDLGYTHSIVNWLLNQQQGRGVFRSTQDTVLGMQALTEYRIFTQRSNLDMNVAVTSDKDAHWREELTLTTAEALVHKQVKVSDKMGNNLIVSVEGRGVAYMLFQMVYNLKVKRDDPEEPGQCSFDLVVNSVPCISDENNRPAHLDEENQNPDCQVLSISAQYRRPESTGMSMIDVSLFTGFVANKTDLEQIKNNPDNKVAMYELSDRMVHFYFDEILDTEPVSVSFRIHREFRVGDVQGVPVTVYKYYDTEVSCTKFYHPDKGSPLLALDCSGDNCKCLEGGCTVCYGFGAGYERPLFQAGMYNLACSAGDTMDYALNATVVDIIDAGPDENAETIHAAIEYVAKKGNDPGMVAGGTIILKRKLECGCPLLNFGEPILIMGKDSGIGQMENGIFKYFYYLDKNTYVMEYMYGRPGKKGASRRLGVAQNGFLDDLKRNGCRT